MDTSSQTPINTPSQGEMVKVLRSESILSKEPDEVIAMGARGEISLFIHVSEILKFNRAVKSMGGVFDGFKIVETEDLLEGFYRLHPEDLERFIESGHQPTKIALEYGRFVSDYDEVPFSQKRRPFFYTNDTVTSFSDIDIFFQNCDGTTADRPEATATNINIDELEEPLRTLFKMQPICNSFKENEHPPERKPFIKHLRNKLGFKNVTAESIWNLIRPKGLEPGKKGKKKERFDYTKLDHLKKPANEG